MPPKELTEKLTKWFGAKGKLLYYNEEAIGLYRTWTFAVVTTGAPQLHFGRVFGSIGQKMEISVDRVIDINNPKELLNCEPANGPCAQWGLEEVEYSGLH